MSATIQRKITIKGCGLSVAAIKSALVATPAVTDADGKVTKPEVLHDSLDLLKVVGIINTSKPGSTDKGEFLKLIGQIQAVNLVTGEAFSAPQCILPDFVTAPLGAALAGGSTEVQFAVLIGVKNAPTSVTGYQYFARPLIEAKPSDAMQALLAAAGVEGAAPALENNPSDAKPEADQAAKPAKTKK